MGRKIFFILTGILFWATAINSQVYQIRIVNRGGGVLAVEMRATVTNPPGVADYITDIVFGIKWGNTENVNLATAITSSFNMKKAGPRNLKSNYYYQAFYSDPIGFNFPSDWALNEWKEILSIPVTQPVSGASLFQISEPGFDITTDPNFGVNFIDFAPVITGGPVSATLPVTLTLFEARADDPNIQLSWKTATELNNKGFEIQRSQNEAADFIPIGWVDGSGNSTSVENYNFKDMQVNRGVKYFYRLKQIDIDGKFSYSAIRTAQLEQKGNLLQLSPNPVSKYLQVTFRESLTPSIVYLQIMSAQGQKIREVKTTAIAGQRVDISVSNLPAGTYFLVALNENEIVHKETFQRR